MMNTYYLVLAQGKMLRGKVQKASESHDWSTVSLIHQRKNEQRLLREHYSVSNRQQCYQCSKEILCNKE